MTQYKTKAGTYEISRPVFAHTLSVDGLGVTYNAAVDGSSTAVQFEFRPTSGVAIIQSLGMAMRDVQTSWTGSLYGVIAGLTNGVDFKVVEGTGASPTTLYTLVTPNVKTNEGYTRFGRYQQHAANTSWQMSAYLDIKNLCDHPLVLDSSKNQALRVTVNDNLTGLVTHWFTAYGYYEKE